MPALKMRPSEPKNYAQAAIYLTEPQLLWINGQAKKRGITRSCLIKLALGEYLGGFPE
jgi:hypothetical protein